MAKRPRGIDDPPAFSGTVNFQIKLDMLGRSGIREAKIKYECTPEWPYWNKLTGRETNKREQARFSLWLLAVPDPRQEFDHPEDAEPVWVQVRELIEDGILPHEMIDAMFLSADNDARRQDIENRRKAVRLVKPISPEDPGRIRRTSVPPQFIQLEENRSAKYPYRFDVSVNNMEFEARFRRGRPFRVDDARWDGNLTGAMYIQEIYCWILCERKQVGAVLLHLWYSKKDLTNEEFFDEMDTFSYSSAQLAEAIIFNWEVDDLLASGAIVEFHEAWVSPSIPEPGVWSAVFNTLIDQHIKREKAILILKAFPTEYEGNLPDGAIQTEFAFNRRMSAMMRYYERKLGVHPLPGEYGQAGWMWKPLLDIPPPTILSDEE